MYNNIIWRHHLGAGQKNLSSHNWENTLLRFYNARWDEHMIEGQQSLIPPCACSFSTCDPNKFAVADEEGGVVIFNIQKYGDHSILKEWAAHNNAVFDIEWLFGAKSNQLLTASGDQTVILSDIDQETKLATYKGHRSSVKCVKAQPGNTYNFASGSRDGDVRLWDMRHEGSSSVGIIANTHGDVAQSKTRKSTTPHRPARPSTPSNRGRGGRPPTPSNRGRGGQASQKNKTDSNQHPVTAMTYSNEHTILTAGTNDGLIKVWDLRKISKKNGISEPVCCLYHPRRETGSKISFTDLTMDSLGSRVFASSKDSHIYQYNTYSYHPHPVQSYKGHQVETFYIRISLSPDDLFLLSGSSDSNAYIWNVENPTHTPVLLTGHTKEVSAAVWSPCDITEVVTLSDDATVKIWRFDEDRMNPDHGPVNGRAELSSTTYTDNGSQTSPFLHHSLRVPGITPFPPSPNRVSNLSQVHPTSPLVTSSHVVTPHKVSNPVGNHPLGSPNSIKWFCRNTVPQIDPQPKPPTPKKLPVIFSPKKQPPPGNVSSPPRRHLSSDMSIASAVSQHQIGQLSLGKEHHKKALFQSNSPIKVDSRLNCAAHASSPTANLPNLVLDPPRTPKVEPIKPKPSTPNWLTQYQQKLGGGGRCSGDESPIGGSDTGSNNTSNSTGNVQTRTPDRRKRLFDENVTPVNKKARLARTPKSSGSKRTKAQVKANKSILTYFSPKNK